MPRSGAQLLFWHKRHDLAPGTALPLFRGRKDCLDIETVLAGFFLARRDGLEYFCETFAAYRFEDGLADKDPEGYDMVEGILRMVWKK
jgi:hypothetical protein